MNASLTVEDFCKTEGICRASLYTLWRQGKGPRFYFIGTHRRISPDAVADWRREREAETAARREPVAA